MQVKINAEIGGKELVEHFVKLLNEQNIKLEWGAGTPLPNGVKIIVHSEKANKDVEVEPDKIKFVYSV